MMSLSVQVSYVSPNIDRNLSNENSAEAGDKTSMSEGTTIFLYISIPLITSVTFLGNIIILAFIIDNRLWNQSNFFLLNLAICDLFIGKSL